MKKNVGSLLLLLFKGMLVGFGAILPGVSGGTLCAAFGMYEPVMNLMAHPINEVRKSGLCLLFFVSDLSGWRERLRGLWNLTALRSFSCSSA